MKSLFFRPNDQDFARSSRKPSRRAGRNRRTLGLEAMESRTLMSGFAPSPVAPVSPTPPAPSASSPGFATLAHNSPFYSNTMMLETDGSVIMEGGGVSNAWYRLTPDATGSYQNGTWTQLASSSLARLYNGAEVLPNGQVFIQGGEYSGASGAETDTNEGEIYTPSTNTWATVATFPQANFGDDPTELLPNGQVLAGFLGGPQTYLYTPSTNTWSSGGTKLRNDQSDEEAWVKLPDNSLLSYDIFSSISTGVGHAQRYIPSTNTWVDAGTVPVSLSSPGVGYELGPGFLLPDGRVFYLGANGNTAYYTESTNSWTAGPVIPNGLGADDAPGAMEPNGKLLFTADTPLFNGPAHILEFDPTSNTYTDLTSSVNAISNGYFNGPSYVDRMLELPSGQILINNGGGQLLVYTPATAALAAATPTVTSVVENADNSFTLTGTGLNGISEGAAYGDDAEMASNYPIVRLTSASNQVFYATTTGWTSYVATGTTPETTKFTLPVGLPAGNYSLAVVAQGAPSANFAFTTPTVAGDPAPTVATAASSSPSVVLGTTANLSFLASDTAGESSLTYTWATTSVPSGVAFPSFSSNGVNASKNDTVTFTHAGSYSFKVTASNHAGLSVSSTVSVTVLQSLTSVAVSGALVNVNPGATQQFSASGLDQFGIALAAQPGFTWSVTSGNGTVSNTGLYTAPPTGTVAQVTATVGSVSGSASAYVLSAPLATQDIGSPQLSGAAGDDSNGTFTLVASGSDIYGTSDQFRFAYTTLTGDGTLIARVTGVQNTSAYAKAGLMVRDGTAANATEAFIAITPTAGATFETRTTVGGSTNAPTTGGPSAPYWIKLVRSGSSFSGYYSPDGVNWTQEGSTITISMNTTVDVGLALTSHNASSLATATFDHVNLNTTPTVATAASATVNLPAATTASLSALGADMAGEANLTYTWATTSMPVGATLPTFSTNGTNAAKNDTATFFKAGNYTFTVTIADSAGHFTTSAASVTVAQSLTSISLNPTSATLLQGATQAFVGTGFDQFGATIASTPFAYTVLPGGAGGTITNGGLYTAPTSTYGTDMVKVNTGSFVALANVTVNQIPATVGATSVGWGTSGASTLSTVADGLRLLPSGRTTDLPWANINRITITLSASETLSPADVTVTGITVANYGPVTISGSGTTYTITLAQPISAADRVTVTVGNAGITTFTRRLDVLPGDVNDDGVVTSADVGIALADATSNPTYIFADVDGDGTVTQADAKKIRALNGTSLPKLG